MEMLRTGSSGDAVRSLQQRLATHGCDPGEIDGIFGPKTEAAVRKFQEERNLQVDGIVGPETFGALEEADEMAQRAAQARKVQAAAAAAEADKERAERHALREAKEQAVAEVEEKADSAMDAVKAGMAETTEPEPKKKRRWGFRGKIDELREMAAEEEERDR